MTPCKHCGEFCGSTCYKALAAKLAAKETMFASLYGAGPLPFAESGMKMKFFNDGTPDAPYSEKSEEIYGQFVKNEPAPNPLIPEALKDFTGAACPDCGNHSWKWGYHHDACKHHNPETCPISTTAHTECKGAKEEKAKKGTFNAQSPAMQQVPKGVPIFMDNETWGLPSDAAYVVGDLSSPNGVVKIKGDSVIEGNMTPKYNHSLYGPQLRNYAAHHGITTKQAWIETVGTLAAQKGYGWANPYALGFVPSIEKNPTPDWPDLYGMGVCGLGANCPVCPSQGSKVKKQYEGTSITPPKDENGNLVYGSTISYAQADVEATKALYENQAAIYKSASVVEPWDAAPPDIDALKNAAKAAQSASAAMKNAGLSAESLKQQVNKAIQGMSDPKILEFCRAGFKSAGVITPDAYVLNLPPHAVSVLALNIPKEPVDGFDKSCACQGCHKYLSDLGLWEAAKALHDKTDSPQSQEQPVSVKALKKVFEKWLDTEFDEDEEFIASLSNHELFVLTGLKVVATNDLAVVRKKAMDVFDEFDDVPSWQEPEWFKTHFIKCHGDSVANVIMGSDMKITKLDQYGVPLPNSFTKINIGADSSNLSTLAANTIAVNKPPGPKWYADQIGAEVKDLKPGDQVIVQVTKEGQLVIPFGMTAMVIPK